MSVKRYYAECTEIPCEFQSRWNKAWQVFDRERTEDQGGCMPIALCIDRQSAFKIRDALNKNES